MRNKIEILRTLCFSKEDLENIQNLEEDAFTDLEVEFMIEFKKIYELGLGQLQKFIDKLDQDGKELEPWDIRYYTTQLLNGPLEKFVLELTKNKKYFKIIPDILGIVGNNQSSRHNTSLYFDDIYPLDVSVDVFNKSPEFIQNNMVGANKLVDEMFRSSIGASIINDNTLPLVDKSPQLRYEEERSGKWVLRSNASYNVRDAYYRNALIDTRSIIFEKVKEIIGEEHFRIFEDVKTYNPFDIEKNNSISIPYVFEKTFAENSKEKIHNIDIIGDVWDDRDGLLKVDNPEKNREYLLHTVEGQFGN